MYFKSNKGITLVALVITIIVLAIITSISIYSGKDVIEKTKLEGLKTNMLLIQAKAKEYVEQANFKMGINPEQKSEEEKQKIRSEVYENQSEEGAQLEKATDIPSNFGVSDSSTCYWLTQKAQEKWGLDKIELEDGEKYLIEFNEAKETVEVYNTVGFNGKYSLTDINTIQL